MLRQHVAVRKLRATSHEFEKRILSISTNEGHIRQIDDQLSALKVLRRVFPGALDLLCPRGNELAFQNQPSLAARLNDGNLEHVLLSCTGNESKMRAKASSHHICRNLLSWMGKRDHAEESVEKCRGLCRQMSKLSTFAEAC